MGDFLKAAYRVLSEKKNPMSSKEIVDFAIKQGFLETYGKTPAQTMNEVVCQRS